MYSDPNHESVEAVVVDQDGNWILVDVDRDGVPDAWVPIGHEAVSFHPNDEVTLIEEPGHVGRYSIVDPADPLRTPAAVVEPEFVRVVGRTTVHAATSEEFWVVSPLSDPDLKGLLVSSTGAPFVQADLTGGQGTVHVAIRRDGSAEWGEFLAVSTHMEHLVGLFS